MGDSAINGKTWNEAELDMVVGDYLVMLDKVMTGRAHDPANHGVFLGCGCDDRGHESGDRIKQAEKHGGGS